MSALRKDKFIKKYVYLFCCLDLSMSTDFAQVVDATIRVISEDVKMRMITNRTPSKSSSYPQNDFFDRQAKD